MKAKAVLLEYIDASNKGDKEKQAQNKYATKIKIVFEMKKWRSSAFC